MFQIYHNRGIGLGSEYQSLYKITGLVSPVPPEAGRDQIGHGLQTGPQIS